MCGIHFGFRRSQESKKSGLKSALDYGQYNAPELHVINGLLDDVMLDEELGSATLMSYAGLFDSGVVT